MATGKGHGSMSLKLKCLRLLLTIVNLSFVIAGLVIVVLGLYVLHNPSVQQIRPLINPDASTNYTPSLSNIEIFAATLIVIGSILLLLGFIGCCATMRGFRSLNIFYAVVIGAMILAQILLILLCVIYQTRLQPKLIDHLQDSIATHYTGMTNTSISSSNSISVAWDFAQIHLKCCGAMGQTDYLQATRWNRTDPQGSNMKLIVPYSCCSWNDMTKWTVFSVQTPEMMQCATTGLNAHSEGCYERLKEKLIEENFIVPTHFQTLNLSLMADPVTRLGVVIYPGFALLDIAGPLQFFNQLSAFKPFEISILAKTMDPVSTKPPENLMLHNQYPFIGESMLPTHTFDNPPTMDILLIPGGLGAYDTTILNDVASFAKSQYPTLKYLLSVCNGSTMLAAAGILDGRKATSNKYIWSSTLAHKTVNWIPKARWVVDGNIWSSSGVAAGMDMTYAFISTLFSPDLAKHIVDVMEYEPHTDPEWDPFCETWNVSSN